MFCDPHGHAQPATRDHIVAKALLEAAHPHAKQVLACYACNQRKGIMSEHEFKALLAAERIANSVTRYALRVSDIDTPR